jgi:hypothetical protein
MLTPATTPKGVFLDLPCGDYKKMIFKSFVLYIAIARTGTILSVIREITQITI